MAAVPGGRSARSSATPRWAAAPTTCATLRLPVAQLRRPATEVARGTGHGVAVLLEIYAHCVDGQADAANRRIAGALSVGGPAPDPGDDQPGDSESAASNDRPAARSARRDGTVTAPTDGALDARAQRRPGRLPWHFH
jgi:hypothetical protein